MPPTPPSLGSVRARRPAAGIRARVAAGGGAPAAFTLMEVLLAVAVASIVLIAITGVFFGALRLRNRTTDTLEAAIPVERALSRIRRDLAGLVPPGGTLAGSFQAGLGVASMTNASAFQFGQVGPEFRTCTGVIGEDLPWAEVQRVAYVLLESTNRAGGRDLYRAVTRNLLGTGVETPESEFLLGNVESLTFWFHDGTQWLESWDSTEVTNTLPRGVKVELQRAPREFRGEPPAPIELVVPLFADGNTNHVPELTGTTNATASGPGGAAGGGA